MALLPTPKEFHQLQEKEQDKLNEYVLEKCKENLLNGKHNFVISLNSSESKGNPIAATSYIVDVLYDSEWDTDTIAVSLNETSDVISFDLMDRDAGTYDDDELIDDASLDDDESEGTETDSSYDDEE